MIAFFFSFKLSSGIISHYVEVRIDKTHNSLDHFHTSIMLIICSSSNGWRIQCDKLVECIFVSENFAILSFLEAKSYADVYFEALLKSASWVVRFMSLHSVMLKIIYQKFNNIKANSGIFEYTERYIYIFLLMQ